MTRYLYYLKMIMHRIYSRISKIIESQFLAFIFLILGICMIFYQYYNLIKVQFDLISLTPILGAALVIIATLLFRINDLKQRRMRISLRAEILSEVRRGGFITKSELLRTLNNKYLRPQIDFALEELVSDNLIKIELDSFKSNARGLSIIKIVENPNLEKLKYEWALTLNQLDLKIDFGEVLEKDIKGFIRNPMNYSVGEANDLLLRIRTFLHKEKNP